MVSCKTDDKKIKTQTTKTQVKIPAFSGDAAYGLVEKQLAFGYRIPGTTEHKACKDWMVEELESYGAEVIVQDFDAKFFTGETVESFNIVAQFNPKQKKRIFVAAHWDSRREADHDPNESEQSKPIMGADDGGSGVAVAMQIAKTLQENPIDMGVDIILFDAEDQGNGKGGGSETWCLGSQYWARNLAPKGYNPQYGILLDMVGSKHPRFAKDSVSKRYAPHVLNKVWTLASNMGYSDMFVNQNGGSITDDHYFINLIANIPTIDIINQKKGAKTGFGSHWHTHDDNIDVIDKRSLRVVGQVVTAVLYKESIDQL